MTHTEFSDSLAKVAYGLKSQCTNALKVDEDILIRTGINRLYYALFNRIIDELPEIKSSSAGQKHERILDRLKSGSGNLHTKRVKDLFSDLQTLRINADYYPEKSLPVVNLDILVSKTFRVIKSKNIF